MNRDLGKIIDITVDDREPLIRVGQGDFARETDDPFDEVGRSSLCGGLEIVGCVLLIVLACAAWRWMT